MPLAGKYTVGAMSDVDAVSHSAPIPPSQATPTPDEAASDAAPADAAAPDQSAPAAAPSAPAPAATFDDGSGGNVDLFA